MKIFKFSRLIFTCKLLTCFVCVCWLSAKYKIFFRDLVVINLTDICSARSLKEEGYHQKVVSYSLYTRSLFEDDFVLRYMEGIKQNYKQIKKLYPGWSMRIYTDNIKMFETEIFKVFYNEIKQNIILCDITTMESFFRNLTNMNGMIWRFLPMFDPTVDIFVSRDMDSKVNEREQSAVEQWIKSDKIFHAMRDNPYHNVGILGGMWGCKNYLLNENIKSNLMNGFLNTDKHTNDQVLLNSVLYPPFQNFIMQHDSYNCQQFPGSIPFPEQRRNRKLFAASFLSDENRFEYVKECPVVCRPNHGKDWKYC